MPTVDLDPGGGQSDTIPVVFTDGPLAGNNQWIIEWKIVQLRQLVIVPLQAQDHEYKVVSIDGDTNVIVDFSRTLP
jgi:hypothetical protein